LILKNYSFECLRNPKSNAFRAEKHSREMFPCRGTTFEKAKLLEVGWCQEQSPIYIPLDLGNQ
jgi:hypothetical protein